MWTWVSTWVRVHTCGRKGCGISIEITKEIEASLGAGGDVRGVV